MNRSASLALLAVAAVMATLVVVIVTALGPGEDALRLVLRCSARLSFMLFLTVFLSSPLHSLLGTPFTTSLVAHRRALGLSFALVHACAGVCILLYHRYFHDSFMHETYPLQRIGGSVGFAAIAVMTITSFDRVKNALAPATWKLIHSGCLYFVSINFLVSFGRRALLLKLPFYMPFFLLLLAAIGVRVLAGVMRARRKQLS
ncbi:MAG TPA: hypothetical protein VFN67_04070 [Polyangiales bacterium]|nr:hypothetical protein [Polyangiales bacterium]